jgi:hypothetical protein
MDAPRTAVPKSGGYHQLIGVFSQDQKSIPVNSIKIQLLENIQALESIGTEDYPEEGG